MVCFSLCIFCPLVNADELYLKDGSIIKGKILEVKNNESYRILLTDGSEIVYSAEKVDKVKFLDIKPREESKITPAPQGEVPTTQSTSQPVIQQSPALTKPEENKIETWGVVTPSNNQYQETSSSNKQQKVGDVGFGVGIGRYGLLGASILFRPVDHFGLDGGVGAYYYYLEYETYGYYDSDIENDSGFVAAYGVEPRIYFTPKTQPQQHCIIFGLYHCEAYGMAYGVAYGYEYHNPGGVGWDFKLGAFIAPDYEEELTKYLDIEEYDPDILIIPILFGFGLTF